VAVDVAVVDGAGRVAVASFAATTLAPMPHLVINEVLANPLGPEPAQEWVEVVNDGQVAASLADFVLGDLGGQTELPAVSLAPQAYALIVNEGFVEDDELDPKPAPGALIVRVPKLGQDGLTNGGEPLKLLDRAGQVVSRWPAQPKPKPGFSVARVDPRAPDGLDRSFAVSTPTPGGSNGL
jgi:hypothetical protein